MNAQTIKGVVMDEQVLLYANVVHKVTSSELPQTET
jgi:hypothetical protein